MEQRRAELGASHLDEGLQRAFMNLLDVSADEAKDRIDKLIMQNLETREVYGMLQEWAHRRVLVDKSPTYGRSLETLQRAETLFDGARYLHLVRHPTAVIESFVRTRMDRLIGLRGADPYATADRIWIDWNRNISTFLSAVEPRRQLRIHFESLVTNPKAVSKSICEFLDIPYDAALLKPYQGERMRDGIKSQSIAVGDPNFLSRRRIDATPANAWKAVRLPRALSDETATLGREMGYEIPSSCEAPGSPVAPVEMQERFSDIGGLSLCVCSWGPESEPMVLCLHGILDQAAVWEEVAAPLAREGLRVVAPDLRGHGRSQHVGAGGSYNLFDFVADADALVRQVGCSQLFLVGHSLGAVVGALLAASRPGLVESSHSD